MGSNTHCEPCNLDGRYVEATVWCTECEEPQCGDCNNSHKRMKMSRNHHTIDIKLVSSSDKTSTIFDKYCKNHTEMAIDAFCTSHDELCCRSCMTGKHRNCEHVLPIEVASRNVKKSEVFTSVSKCMNNMSSTTNLIEDGLKKNQQHIDSKVAKLTKDVSVAKQKIIDQLDIIENTIMEEIQREKSEATSKINRKNQEINEIKSRIVKKIQDFEFIENHGSNNQAFVFSHRVQSDVHDLESLLIDMTELKHYDLLFDDSSADVISSLKEFGKITVTERNEVIPYSAYHHSQAQSLAAPTQTISRLELDHKFHVNSRVYGITVTKDKQLLFCEYENMLLNKANFNGKVTGSIKMESRPHGITFVTSTESAVVTLPHVGLQFVSVRDMKKIKKVKLPDECKGISSSSEKIVVGGLTSLYIFDTTGRRIQTLAVSNKASFPIQFLHVSSDDNILYTDTTAVYKVNITGNILWKHSDPDLEVPQGITEDGEGRIYVVYIRSKSVVILNNRGEYQNTILSNEDEFNNPWAICFSSDYTTLFVTNNEEQNSVLFRFRCIRN